jgi:hypothetical protein
MVPSGRSPSGVARSKVISFAYAYEQRAQARVAPTSAPRLEAVEPIAPALAHAVAAE